MQTYSDFAQHMQRVFAAAPEAMAIESEGTIFSWRDLQRASAAIAAQLDALGLGEGAAVGVLARNRFGQVAALVAILTSGRCFVTLNPIQEPLKIARDLRGLRLPVVIASTEDLADSLVQEALQETGTVALALEGPSSSRLRALPRGVAVPKEHHRALPATAVLMLSSGTTGEPKRIPLGYRSLLVAVSDQLPADYAERSLEIKKPPALISNPMVHIGGLFFAVKTLVDARQLVLLDRFQVETFVDTVERHGIRVGNLVPTAIRMICDAEVPRVRLAGLRAVVSGASPLSPELQRTFEEKYGIPVLIVYGATEFAGAVAGWTLPMHKQFIDTKRGSVGRAMPGCELRVVDPESGAPVPTGATGLLEVHTVQSGREDWVRTTDLAALDSEGFLWIKGRADAAINRGGFKVLPEEIQIVLKEHPAVLDAAVVGIPDERLGEVPVAAVELRTGRSATEAELMAFARDRLTRYQAPAQIKIVAALPRSAALKPILPEVRALFAGR